MKKTFRTILAGAVALLAVSCYDDSYLQEKVKNHEDRLTAIENTLNAEIGGINDLANRLATLEGKVAAIKVETVDGVTTLTLSDESTIVLATNGSLSIVEQNGVNYWATVAEDGTTVPVGIKVGDNLLVRVNETTSELEISYDGTTYETTGVKVSAYTAHVIGDVVEAENGASVTVTIGDAEYVLPLYNLEFALSIKAGKSYFDAGETRVFEVGFEGVSNLAVMNQPNGWDASVKGSKLTVTAPVEANMYAAKDGLVILHGDANGRCMTATLSVAVGAGFELTVSPQGEISVVNPIVATVGDDWFGYQTTFANAYCGVVSVDAYSQFNSFAEFVEAVEYGVEGLGVSAYLENIKNNLELGSYYDEASGYVVDEYTVSVEEFAGAFSPALELVKGEKYVIWAVPQTTEVLMDDYVLAFYEPVIVELNEEISFNEISLTLGVYGAEGAYVGVMSAAELESYGGMSFDEYMQMNIGMGARGPWAQMQLYGMEAIGPLYGNGGSVSVAELNYGALSPDTKYYVWAMPNKGLAPSEYDYETDFKPYVFELTTSGIVAGGTAAELSLNDATDYFSISVDVTVPESTTAYYYFYGVGATDAFETELDLVKDVLDSGTEMIESGIAKKTYLNAGDTQILVVLTLTADGKYALAQGSFATLSYPIVETITTSVESVTKTESGYSAVINVTGATKVAVYTSSSDTYSNFNKYLMSKNTAYKYADVVDGKATVAFTASNDNYYMLVAGFNENEDGSVKEISAYVPTKIADKLQ